MKFGINRRNDKENKKFYQSLNWVTMILGKYFNGHLGKEETDIVEKSLYAINMQPIPADSKLSSRVVNKSDKNIHKMVFEQIQPTKTISLKTRYLKFSAVAAAIIAIFTISYFTFKITDSSTNSYSFAEATTTPLIETGDAEIKEITLPDGTNILVNANTSIRYNKELFNKTNREVWIEGEAFFEVAKNPKKPFIIYSHQLQTTVKGTSFNVKAYPEIGETGISVREGKVEVSERNGKTLATLTADKKITYNNYTGTNVVETSNWQNEAAWHEQRLALNDANIAELQLRLKQIYGATLTIESGIPYDTRFGLSFRQGASLAEVLNLIAKLYNVQYRIESTNQIIIYQ